MREPTGQQRAVLYTSYIRALTFPVNHFDRPPKRASTASPCWWCRSLTDAPERVGERPSVTAGLEGTRRLGRFLSTACDASSPSWSSLSSLSRAKSISLSIFRRAARLSRSFSFLLLRPWLLSSSPLPVVLFLAVEICRPSSSPCEELWRPPRRSDFPFGVERRFLLTLLGSRLRVRLPAISLGGVCCCMVPNNHKERNAPCSRRVQNSGGMRSGE